MSKFLPDEFVPYANYWGRPPEERSVSDRISYKRAVQLHKRRNRHHWEWWIEKLDGGAITAQPMDTCALTEMLCDWHGAGRAYDGADDTQEYYKKNFHRIDLHPRSRAWLENKLGLKQY